MCGCVYGCGFGVGWFSEIMGVVEAVSGDGGGGGSAEKVWTLPQSASLVAADDNMLDLDVQSSSVILTLLGGVKQRRRAYHMIMPTISVVITICFVTITEKNCGSKYQCVIYRGVP